MIQVVFHQVHNLVQTLLNGMSILIKPHHSLPDGQGTGVVQDETHHMNDGPGVKLRPPLVFHELGNGLVISGVQEFLD